MGGTNYLTDDDRLAEIRKLGAANSKESSPLLIPALADYESLSDDDGLIKLTKTLCQKLGYKPRKLTVAYGQTATNKRYAVSESSIVIDESYRNHPFLVGGLLAKAAVKFVVNSKNINGDERLIELATIEYGLGLWLINSYSPRYKFHELLYNYASLNWQRIEPSVLKDLSSDEYLAVFLKYTEKRNLHADDYLSGLSRKLIYLVPATPSSRKQQSLAEPSQNAFHTKQSRKLMAKIVLLALIISAVLIFATILMTVKGGGSASTAKDSESARIYVLKDKLGACQTKLQGQKNSLNHDDIFMSRQIEATQTECQSLSNQYDSALSAYQDSHYAD